MLGKAASLVGTFHTLDQQLGQQASQVNQRISDSVSAINSLAQSIAGLNQQINREAAGGTPPSDLLDRRDQLIQQLSEQVGVTTSTQGNSINVFTGNGQTPVSGSTALALNAAPDPYDPTRVNVVSQTGATLDGQLQGGSLGGLLDYRSSVLEPARNQLGRAAIAFASAVNAQHRQGMDLNGQLGGDLFSLPAPQALPADGNAGNATMTANVTDVGALTSSDYILRFDGSEWKATTTGGNPVTVTGNPTGPLEFDGLKLEIAGSASAGDTFRIEPTRAAAGGIQLAVNDPNQLALAAPFKITAADDNQAAAGAMKITDGGNPNVLQPVSIEFTSDSTYSINGTGSYPYTTGSPIEVNGWSLALNGSPATGDQFTIKSNSDGVGDNSNALALGETADLGVLAGGTVSAGAAYASLIADTGTTGAQAQVNLDSQTSLFQQAQQSQQSLAGVNLDEEAGNLIKYQQSYQAAAQVISTANTIFNTLINAVRD
jgi:flagellar hook-associated protein 1 FlgK